MDILVVDDEPGIRMGVVYSLCDAGHDVVEAEDGAEALRLVGERVFDVIICDIRLPKIDGITVLKQVHLHSPRTAVILMTAYARVADAIAALKEGAYDYVVKPFDGDEFPLVLISRIEEQQKLDQELSRARDELGEPCEAPQIIGRSPPMARLLAQIDTIAYSDAPVLITGESGTGKELFARTLHARSQRSSRSFVAINCAALPETLLEAELFGHERGAFTGAVRKREGRFKTADGGTILLDEVAEMSLPAQAKLLRVLQEGVFEPVGTSASIRVDVRILSATHQSLKQRVAEGRFREDLYYRLNVLDLAVPALRDRLGDLPLLFEHFARKVSPPGQRVPGITTRAWQRIMKHGFPGNVREFAHAVERAVILARGSDIDLQHLPPDILGDAVAAPMQFDLQPLSVAMRRAEREHIAQAMQAAGGKRTRAAELLGISRKSLWEKLRLHGLDDASEPAETESDIDPPQPGSPASR
jgi:DNA-binding NtrC family response regulator